jgi:hypothetical protein
MARKKNNIENTVEESFEEISNNNSNSTLSSERLSPDKDVNKKMDKVNISQFFDYSKQKSFINRLNNKIKIEKITTGDDPRLSFRKLPTSSIGLNRKLGGGFARRKIHLSWGERSSGKSFFDYKNIAILQRLCRNCLGVLPFDDKVASDLRTFFAFENCSCGNPQMHRCGRVDYESDYESVNKPEETDKFKNKETHMKKIGIIPEALTVMFASSIEECIDIAKDTILNKELDYFSIDSLQGGQTKTVFDKDGVSETMGIDPKKINVLLRDIMYAFHHVGIDNYQDLPVVHIIAQVRMKMGPTMSFASFSGGKGLEHQVSVILKWVRESYLGANGQELDSIDYNSTYGIRTAYKNEKSKLDEPYFSGKIDIITKDTTFGLNHGDINYLLELVDIGIESGKIRQSGAYFYIGEDKFQGYSKLQEALRNDKELVKKII